MFLSLSVKKKKAIKRKPRVLVFGGAILVCGLATSAIVLGVGGFNSSRLPVTIVRETSLQPGDSVGNTNYISKERSRLIYSEQDIPYRVEQSLALISTIQSGGRYRPGTYPGLDRDDFIFATDQQNVVAKHPALAAGDGNTAPIPIPGTLFLLGSGLAGIAGIKEMIGKSKLKLQLQKRER